MHNLGYIVNHSDLTLYFISLFIALTFSTTSRFHCLWLLLLLLSCIWFLERIHPDVLALTSISERSP